jgi:hypothetical protein
VGGYEEVRAMKGMMNLAMKGMMSLVVVLVGISAGPASTSTMDLQTNTVEIRVAASADDAEERASGSVKLTSSDLELVFDKSDQTIGLRFTNLDIPPGATITNAYIQFQADESQSVATSLHIHGEATDNATTFINAASNVSSRPTTTATVGWGDNSPNPLPAWTKGDATLDQRTPDLTAIVQEIVDQYWTPQSDSMAFIFSGTGHRTAESFDGNAPAAALLHVELLIN